MCASVADFIRLLFEGRGMMESLKTYLLSVVAVCLIAAIAGALVKNPLIGKILRLVSGILVLLVVVSPLLEVDLDTIATAMRENFSSDSSMLEDVRESSQRQLAEQIKRATELHIEQTAANMGVLIQAKVRVNDDKIPTPISVEMIGVLEAEELATLSEYIAKNIGIPKERQEWRGYEANP